MDRFTVIPVSQLPSPIMESDGTDIFALMEGRKWILADLMRDGNYCLSVSRDPGGAWLIFHRYPNVTSSGRERPKQELAVQDTVRFARRQ